MAVVGQGYAVLQSGPVHLKGVPAFTAWAMIHVLFLAQPGLRLRVFLQWLWTLFTRQRGSRLIVKPGKSGTLAKPPEVPQAAATAR
jgi:NADH dehydrogenase